MKRWSILAFIIVTILVLGICLYRINKQDNFIKQVEELSKENTREDRGKSRNTNHEF